MGMARRIQLSRLQSFLHSAQQPFAVALRQPAVQARFAGQSAQGSGGCLGNPHQLPVADDLEARAVLPFGDFLSKFAQGLQNGRLAGIQVTAFLDGLPARSRLRRRIQGKARETGKIFFGQRAQAGLLQRLPQALPQGDEIVGIQLGVEKLLRRERPFGPVGALVTFIRLHAEMPLQQSAQPDLLVSQQAGRPHRIEEILEGEGEIPPQAKQIVFGGVEDFFNLGSSKNRGQQGQIGQRQGVQEVVFLRGGELNQADLLLVGVQTVGLGIHRDGRLLLKVFNQGAQPCGRVHPHSGRQMDRIHGNQAFRVFSMMRASSPPR